MTRFRLSDRLIIVFGLSLLLMVALACGSSTTEQMSEAAQPVAATDSVDEPIPADADSSQEPEAANPESESSSDEDAVRSEAVAEEPTTSPTEEAPVETPTEVPTEAPPEPTATTPPEVEPATLVTSGFGQEGRSVSYAFIVTNPNPGIGLEDVGYQITALDSSGAIVETDSSSIPALFPGDTLGIGGDLFVEENVIVDSIDVQLSRGDSTPSEPIPNFTTEQVTYIPGDYTSQVTGVISSPFSRQFDDLRVSAITYDAEDNINGGGYTYVDFVPANGTTGVNVTVNTTGEVARAEIFPIVSFLSLFRDEATIPDDGLPVELIAQGFGQGEFGSSFGMILQNPNETYALNDSRYQVTAYDAGDIVVGTDSGYIEVLLPGQTLGVAGDLFIPGDGAITRIEAQFAPGDYVAPGDLLPFTTSDATFAPGSFSSEINGQVNNPYSEEVTDLRVMALAYDEAGNIIGGGYTFLDFVPAESSASISVPVEVTGTPATVELYAVLTSLSEFGGD